jgi:hypothetical protein
MHLIITARDQVLAKYGNASPLWTKNKPAPRYRVR